MRFQSLPPPLWEVLRMNLASFAVHISSGLFVGTTLAACGRSAPGGAPDDASGVVARLVDTVSPILPAAAAESDPTLRLGRLGAAVLVDGAVVVLDMLPPHVKVYDSSGTGVRSFLQAGEGPGEMQMPVAITRWDDSSVVVADVSGRLAHWTLDGTLLAEGPGVPGLPVMGMVRCGDELVIYGPTRDTNNPTNWAWLRAIGADLATVTRSGMSEAAESGEIHGVGGRLYGMHAALDGAITIRHQFGPNPAVVRLTCADLTTVTRLFTLPPSVRMAPPNPGSTVVAPPRVTGPRPAGMTVFGEAVVLASRLVPTDQTDPDSTRFTVIRGTGVDSLDVPGSFSLHGSAAGVALVGSDVPREGLRLVRVP